eukprot:scaffold47625_cov81-Attheya_sp.AAC.2
MVGVCCWHFAGCVVFFVAAPHVVGACCWRFAGCAVVEATPSGKVIASGVAIAVVACTFGIGGLGLHGPGVLESGDISVS